MGRYDASTVQIQILTFKEGMLSMVAHDLKLRATKFTLDTDGVSASLEVDASSLRMVTSMKDGAENPSGVPQMVYGEIEKNVSGDVLEAKKYPSIRFSSTRVTDTEVIGSLTLHGQTHEVRGSRSGNSVEFRIDQRQFGIKPFSAMLGTLKVKPEVRVQVSLPAEVFKSA